MSHNEISKASRDTNNVSATTSAGTSYKETIFSVVTQKNFQVMTSLYASNSTPMPALV